MLSAGTMVARRGGQEIHGHGEIHRGSRPAHGDHSNTHPHFTMITGAKIRMEVLSTETEIKSVTRYGSVADLAEGSTRGQPGGR